MINRPQGNIFERIGGLDKNLTNLPQGGSPSLSEASKLLGQQQMMQQQGNQALMSKGVDVVGGMATDFATDKLKGIFEDKAADLTGSAVSGAMGMGSDAASLAAAEASSAAAEGVSGGLGPAAGAGLAGTGVELGASLLGADETTADIAGKAAKYGTAFAMGGPFGLLAAGAPDLLGIFK